MSFVHLHNHSFYSLLDGLPSPEALAKRAKAQGSPAIALTDHGVMYGALDFYKACKKEGVKAIIGCEVYMAARSRFDKTGDDRRSTHLVLLAENRKGYENLLILASKANLEGMYYKPRVDLDLLREHSEGVIALSACMGGVLAVPILNGDEKWLDDTLAVMLDIFGRDHFFVEIQSHPEIPGQIELTRRLVHLAREKDLQLVATNDAHYLDSDDAEAQDVLICIQTNREKSDPSRMTMLDSDYSLRSPEEMRQLFSETPDAIENTLKIAERCDLSFDLGSYEIPEFPRPEAFSKKTAGEFLRHLCVEGLRQRYPAFVEFEKGRTEFDPALPPSENGKTIADRFEYEFSVIEKMGFADYFLIVADYVAWAKAQGIMVGPGRGSGAGSIIAYALTITNLDPLQFGLLFERFLNPERISMPDFDIDFADDRRGEVLEYVSEKYGSDRVAQISTFGTMAAKAAVKDVGRAFGVPFGTMNDFSKLIPDRPGVSLADAFSENPAIDAATKKDPQLAEVWRIAQKLEGCVRHISVHACAVVISAKPLLNYTAVQHPPKDDHSVITQFSAKPLEALGLLKMDFLGLKNLTILQHAVRIIKRQTGRTIDIEHLPIDDAKSYELFQRAETTGIFQFESAGMKRYLKELKPTVFEDLIAMNALYRPGPMEFIPDFIASKNGKKPIVYPDPCLEPILAKTYGVGVYQEQILEMARAFAGYSLGEADILRRAIGKKIASEMEAQRAIFIEKSAVMGRTEKLAVHLFDDIITPFAGYGFNKSHSAAYAMIAYETAFLKAHFPTEFMAALLSSDAENSDRIAIEIDEARAMGIEIFAPSVNESLEDFTVVGNRKIRFGLTAIKGVGSAAVDAVMAARGVENIRFSDLDDFLTRVELKHLNRKTLEAFVKSGAMDDFGERKALLASVDAMIDHAKTEQKHAGTGQMGLFGEVMGGGGDDFSGITLSAVDAPATRMERLSWEKELLGLYVSGHPLAGLSKYWRKKAHAIGEIDEKMAGKPAKIGGIVTELRVMTTKSKEQMAAVTVEDPSGKLELVFFPKYWREAAQKVAVDGLILASGRIEKRGGFQLSADSVVRLDLEKMRDEAKSLGLLTNDAHLPVPQRSDENDATIDPELEIVSSAVGAESIESFDASPSSNLDATFPESDDAAGAQNLLPKLPDAEPIETAPLILQIPATATRETLVALRALCDAHSGPRAVELRFADGTVKTPAITVSASSVFEQGARAVLEGEESIVDLRQH